MRRSYQKPIDRTSRKLARVFAGHEELFLPFLELIEESSGMVTDVLDVVSRASIEAILELSAAQVAGGRHRGKRGGPIGWHGSQPGVVTLSDRKIRVTKPRLREKSEGEVAIPAYESLRSHPLLGKRIEKLLMHGVSTRRYAEVIGEMAETVGVSKSSISREFLEASAASLEELTNRRLEDLDLLVIYLDGVQFGGHHVIGALGVDRAGTKHVLGIVPGASENLEASIRLLESLVERGVDPKKRYLFVMDGAKALRSAVRQVFGRRQYVQRCRLHKIRNVLKELPKDLGRQVRTVMRAAFKLDPKEGMARLKRQAEWLQTDYPGAAASLREGLEEMFTVARLDVSPSLHRCLVSTNIIESPIGTIQYPMGRVTNWQGGEMVARWAASAFLAAEKRFRKILGYQDLWQLEAALRGKEVDEKEVAA